MCKFCNTRIDWERKDTCSKHVSCDLHKKKKEDAIKLDTAKRQLSISDSLQGPAKKHKVDKEDFIMKTTEAFMKANIPLEKMDNPDLRAWMNKYIEGAGDLPTADTLRTSYVNKVGAERQAKIKEDLKNQQVVVLCDETTDRNGKCVFAILLRVLNVNTEPKMYVGGITVLENATASECFKAINAVLNKFEINFNNVVSLSTDGARYMTLTANTLKVPIPELIHVQCWAHKLNLVASLWTVELPELNKCVTNTKMLFLNTRKRKHRYISHLRAKYPEGEKKCVLFPSPAMTRWTSWFKSALYVGDYITDLVSFTNTLDEESSAVKYFQGLSSDEVLVIQAMATFLLEHCQKLIDTIVVLEGSKYPFAHQVYHKVKDIHASFKIVANGQLHECTADKVGAVRNIIKKSDLTTKLKNVGLKCSIKITQLIAGDSAKDFVHNVGKLFDVRNITSNEVIEALISTAKKISLLSSLNNINILEGYAAFQTTVQSWMESGTEEPFDILKMLRPLRESHKAFAEASIKAVWIPVSNVDSERAFSMYGNILTDLRTQLKPENVEILMSVTFGNQNA